MQLVGIVGVREQERHRPEGLAAEVAVEARGQDARSPPDEAERDLDDAVVEELHLVDADNERGGELGVLLDVVALPIEMQRRRLPACETTSVSP